MADKVRVALIGAGGMANAVHYPSLAEMDDVEMVALCDLVPGKLEAAAARFSIPRTYSDYRVMLEQEDPDAVYVLMPSYHHFDIVTHCLRQGLHVFVEKPPAVTTYQTKAFARLAERHDCITMVGFNRRFIPLMRRVREMQLQSGDLNLAVATFYKAQPEATYYGGAIDVLHVDAIHAVDALRWMGGEVASLASHIASSSSAVDNRFLAIVEFESGASGVLLTNWDSGGRSHTFEMHAPGFLAQINPDPGGQALVYQPNKDPQRITSEEAAGSDQRHHVYGFFGESRHFIDCVKLGIQTECSFADSVRSMELADLILASCI